MNKNASVIAILTSHNRKSETIECLERLWISAQYAGVQLEAILVDDGSIDGTAEAVRKQFPWVYVDVADGSLYWTRGMRRAEMLALQQSGWDYLLWLNDDTFLFENALTVLLESMQQCFENDGTFPIIVGSTQDIVTKRRSYGGSNGRTWYTPFGAYHVGDQERIEECNVFTGNLVLIPKHIVNALGGIDEAFEHAMGDTDYARRTIKLGFKAYVAPGFLACCTDNPVEGTYRDRSLPLGQRWNLIMDKKGLPPKSWFILVRRHWGCLWPIVFAMPYLKLILSLLHIHKIK